MDAWLDELEGELSKLNDAGLRRQLREAEPMGRLVRVGEREMLNLASNDYLGLASHPRLRKAAIDAIERYGVGSGASPLVTGHHPLHAQVEAAFAAFKHAERALILPTGYAANLAALTALAGPGDLICLDKLCHASLIDAARASGATVRSYAHLDVARLERLLHRDDSAAAGDGPRRRFIVTDAVFSMDGDVADLPALCELADRYDAILVVDEAHGTGVLGPTGAGLSELQGVAKRVDVTVSTASKALGGLGGIVTARASVIETMVNRARPLIYSTAPSPAQVAAICAAIEVVRDEPWRRERVLALARRVRGEVVGIHWLIQAELNDADLNGIATPIIPLIVGEPTAALALSVHLAERGILAPAIRPPSVAPGLSRVRLSLRADLTDGDLDLMLAALREFEMG